MINFVDDIFKWLAIGLGMLILCMGLYKLLKFFAKEGVEKELQAQREQLQRNAEDLKWQQENMLQTVQQAQAKNNAFYVSVLKKQTEVELRYQQAREMLTQAKKIEADAEIKVPQAQKENSKLQRDLNAARQRAKRLAKRTDTNA